MLTLQTKTLWLNHWPPLLWLIFFLNLRGVGRHRVAVTGKRTETTIPKTFFLSWKWVWSPAAAYVSRETKNSIKQSSSIQYDVDSFTARTKRHTNAHFFYNVHFTMSIYIHIEKISISLSHTHEHNVKIILLVSGQGNILLWNFPSDAHAKVTRDVKQFCTRCASFHSHSLNTTDRKRIYTHSYVGRKWNAEKNIHLSIAKNARTQSDTRLVL